MMYSKSRKKGIMLILSKVFLLFKPEIKTPKRSSLSLKCFYHLNRKSKPRNEGIQNSEFKWLTTLIHTWIRVSVLWLSRRTVLAHNPPPVSWPQGFKMEVSPNFGHSDTHESLLTQVTQETRLITILPLGERMWQRYMSHDTAVCARTPAPRQRHTRELTYKGRSEVEINVGFQYLSFESAVEGLPMKPVSRKSAASLMFMFIMNQ